MPADDETKPESTENTEPAASESAPEAPATSENASTESAAEASSTEAASSEPEAPSAEEPAAPAVAATTQAPEKAAAPAAKKPAAASASAKLTPGQRLAAQKAAKAEKKSATKLSRKEEEEAARAASEILTTRPAGEPDETEIRVAETRTYVASHSKQLVYAAAALTLAFFAWLGFEKYSDSRDAAAGRLLAQATDAARAEIREEPIENDRSHKLTFRSVASRDREALRRFRKVVSSAPSSDAAVRARLGIASILVAQGKLTEAQRELRAAAELRGDDPGLGAQAIEGLGVIALEQRHFADAKQRFEELRSLDNNRYQHVANYLTARTLFAQGKAEEAKPKLRALIDALAEPDAPRLPYIQTQAELLLQQIDPSTARPRPAGLGGGGGGGFDLSQLGADGQIPPELLEQIQRQMQEQQQQGGAPQ